MNEIQWWADAIFTDGTNDIRGVRLAETSAGLYGLRQFYTRGSADHYWVGYGFEIQEDTEDAEYTGPLHLIDWTGFEEILPDLDLDDEDYAPSRVRDLFLGRGSRS